MQRFYKRHCRNGADRPDGARMIVRPTGERPAKTGEVTMRALFKSSFVWQFAGGFALGALGLVVLHPAEAPSRYGSAPIEAVR